jgi:general secretion pathway protein E
MSNATKEIHNTALKAISVDGFDLSIKSFVLFTIIDNETVIAINQDHLHDSFDYINKHSLSYNIVFLDTSSFEILYNKALEIRADKQMSEIASDQENAVIDDEDYSISDFLKTSSDIMTSEESAPIIKFVNSLFYQAIKKKASDIHIEMHEFKGEIRYRVDGVLSKHIELDKNIMTLVISRLKVISNLDISETRVPQDGRTQIKISGTTLDIRVSILPNFFGERVVMRILMQSNSIPSLEELGLDKSITQQLALLCKHSHGMILVTGPTGSGKSTTLHSLLQTIYSPEKNIITVEDPVEYKSDHINQIQQILK